MTESTQGRMFLSLFNKDKFLGPLRLKRKVDLGLGFVFLDVFGEGLERFGDLQFYWFVLVGV